MFISLNWLKDYLSLSKDFDPENLAHQLTMSTVEVESVRYLGNELEKIVSGQIKEIIKHPKADKLSICQVDVGAEKYLQIVCGGRNIYKDMKVAVALVGSQVFWHGKEPQQIVIAKIRGVESQGMICAASEIGLENYFLADDILDLKNYKAKVGMPLTQVLDITDVVLEVENKSLTNRPDLWGHYGLAREIAAIYKLKLKPIPLTNFKTEKKLNLEIKIENNQDCPRYQGIVLDQIKIRPSPEWLKNKLLAVGQRPINNVVDITNYVMLELGQPLHAFDYEKVKNHQIIIKRASPRQHFSTLDGQLRKLSEGILLINDAENPLAIAGIMGGKNSEISEKTKTIIIESANFNPYLIRKGSMTLSLRTEASSRFEKGLDPNLTETALKRAVSLIKEVIPESKVASNIIEAGDYHQETRVIELDLNLLQRRIGEKISLKETKDILELLSFGVKDKKNLLIVTVPSFRAGRDINLPEDLIEEVARIYGYNKINPVLPTVDLKLPEINLERKYERQIKTFLSLALGFNEVYNYSLINIKDIENLNLKEEDHFHLKNFISTDQTLLRTNLITNLLKNVRENLKYYNQFRLFELGRIFKKKAGDDFRDPEKTVSLPQQEKHLCGIVVGEINAFLAIKGALADLLDRLNIKFEFKQDENFYPWAEKKKTLKVIINDQILGALGEINPGVKAAYEIETDLAFFDINFSKIIKLISGERKFKPLLKFPEVVKDLSIIINNNILWAEIEKEIFSISNLITKVELFDIYQSTRLGEDKKSLAFHITFYNPERTLISNEISLELQKIITALEKKFQATIRKV